MHRSMFETKASSIAYVIPLATVIQWVRFLWQWLWKKTWHAFKTTHHATQNKISCSIFMVHFCCLIGLMWSFTADNEEGSAQATMMSILTSQRHVTIKRCKQGKEHTHSMHSMWGVRAFIHVIGVSFRRAREPAFGCIPGKFDTDAKGTELRKSSANLTFLIWRYATLASTQLVRVRSSLSSVIHVSLLRGLLMAEPCKETAGWILSVKVRSWAML